MKKILSLLLIAFTFTSCAKLDLNPLSEGSSENWYADDNEINLSLNDLYREYLWDPEVNYRTERMTDNWSQRQTMNDFPAGSINSDWAVAELNWTNAYKGISRANTIINNLVKLQEEISPSKRLQYEAEARFIRASMYGRLVFFWGDAPFYLETIDIDEAFKLGRTSKDVILKQVYEDYDFAAQHLPKTYGDDQLKRSTKGAALAMKARTALNMGDYATARDAAKLCMDLGVYSLYPEYGAYFSSKTRNVDETIFAVPRSLSLGSSWKTSNFIPRNQGGTATAQPSWDLFFAFLCSDGLPIDESPLFNPRKPFDNRDPRLAETIVEFGSPFLGFVYDPNPYTTTVKNVNSGISVKNNDTRSVNTYASYNGLALKKGVDTDWSDDQYTDGDIIIMRYADVLLMYAEAKIELGEIDATVLAAMNAVRARAYGVSAAKVNDYPAITQTSQVNLRKIIRAERRMEFSWENRRYDDLIRWRIAEKALTQHNFGLLDPSELKSKIVDKGLWFFPRTPSVDDNGLVELENIYNQGFIKKLADRNFDASKQYLWPIPFKEIAINKNIIQNPNY